MSRRHRPFLPATRLSRQTVPRQGICRRSRSWRKPCARLERYEGALNAFVLYDPDSAMAAARASEARWQRGEPQGLLDGVPVALKDTLLTRGWPRLVGSRTIDPNQPWTEDSPAVARLRDAGALFFGKTTTPEFGWKAVTDLPLSGITRNPWNLAAHPRRQQRRQRRRGAGRHLPAGGRHRCRRLDPHSGRVLRHFRAEADLRPGRGLSALGLWRCRPCRADDAHGGRRRADARRDQGAGFARLVQPAR